MILTDPFIAIVLAWIVFFGLIDFYLFKYKNYFAATALLLVIVFLSYTAYTLTTIKELGLAAIGVVPVIFLEGIFLPLLAILYGGMFDLASHQLIERLGEGRSNFIKLVSWLLFTTGVAFVLYFFAPQYFATYSVKNERWWANNRPVSQPTQQEVTKQQVVGQVDTSSYKTYRNEKYGFAVKYPADWTVNLLDKSGYSAAESDATDFGISEGRIKANGKPSGCISCSYFSVKPTICEKNYPAFQGETAKGILLDGVPARQFIDSNKLGEPPFFSMILFSHDKPLWNPECSSIRMYVNPTYEETERVEHTKILNDVLASFKFTK